MAPSSRPLLQWAVFGVVLVAAPVLLYRLGLRSDNRSVHYDTFAAAEQAGAVTQGWIPAYLPPSARAIEESHDLDTNAQRVRFRAPPQDLRTMAGHLEPISGALVGRAGDARQNPALAYFVERRAGSAGKSGESARCFELDFAAGTAEMWSCVPEH